MASKSCIRSISGSKPPGITVLTEFQKVFLADFYENTKRAPRPEDLDYLTDHLNASRETIMTWFRMKLAEASEIVETDKWRKEVPDNDGRHAFSPPLYPNHFVKPKKPANPFIVWLGEERRRHGGGEVKLLSEKWRNMGEDQRKEEAERARISKEERELVQAPMPQPQGRKDFHCPSCGVGFSTKGNMCKHIRTFHEEQDEEVTSRRELEEEPVTFESFKKYFDREAVERDPQDFFCPKPTPGPSSSGKGSTKTRFTPHQRTVLSDNFHRYNMLPSIHSHFITFMK